MAIFEEKMYGLQCDNCDEICSDGNGINIWPDRNQAIANAQEWNEWIEHEGKYYCPKCYEIDDNDCVIIKAKKIMKQKKITIIISYDYGEKNTICNDKIAQRIYSDLKKGSNPRHERIENIIVEDN
jgi:hypothetical protein